MTWTEWTMEPMSPNFPPAFMRMPPPMVPGMPARHSMPDNPCRMVRSSSFCMSAPAPTSSLVFVDLDAAEEFGIEAEDRAVHAGVADQQIGARGPGHKCGCLIRRSGARLPAVLRSELGRMNQRRAADAIPRVLRQRDVLLDDLFQAGKWVREFQHDFRHILQTAVRSLPISQMFPAPMVTIKSSSRAFSFKYSTI